MMNLSFSFLLGMTLYALTTSQATAHSMKEALDELQQSERYLQQVNRVAPDTGIRVAKTYGLEFVVVSGEEQMHGVVTHVIDPQGVMKARFHGLRFKLEHLTAFVSSLLRSDHDEGWADAGSVSLPWWETQKYQLIIGLLLILGLPLLVAGGLHLKRYIARHRSAPSSVNASQDAGSSRPDA